MWKFFLSCLSAFRDLQAVKPGFYGPVLNEKLVLKPAGTWHFVHLFAACLLLATLFSLSRSFSMDSLIVSSEESSLQHVFRAGWTRYR